MNDMKKTLFCNPKNTTFIMISQNRDGTSKGRGLFLLLSHILETLWTEPLWMRFIVTSTNHAGWGISIELKQRKRDCLRECIKTRCTKNTQIDRSGSFKYPIFLRSQRCGIFGKIQPKDSATLRNVFTIDFLFVVLHCQKFNEDCP